MNRTERKAKGDWSPPQRLEDLVDDIVQDFESLGMMSLETSW